ncbi:uncharacterized protein LOC106629329 isoform X1 [Zonotrichia albicollis]|uniref:uncharacterized protein LOC106629329 isoform X1 n=1 Tax=Zonotrichia albicollis TaxID=44394 RepID=UPI003D80D524
MVKSPRFQAVEMHIQPWHSHAEFLSAVPAGKLSDRATGAPAAETEETLLHHVPAEPPPPFCSQGWDWEPPPCRQRAAPGLASLPEGRGCSELLMRDMHACAWLGIRGAPVPDPATRGSCCSCRCYPVQLAEPPALAVACSSFQLWN